MLAKQHISGLGAGTSATALSRHNVSTTIVEIDPAVYNASLTYFGLPEPSPDQLFLMDARLVVHDKRQEYKEGSPVYDYVIHDCFSGGGVPSHLYTVEFYDDLKVIMHPEGVIVVVRILYVSMVQAECDPYATLELRRDGWLRGISRCFTNFARELWTMQNFP